MRDAIENAFICLYLTIIKHHNSGAKWKLINNMIIHHS